MQMLRVVMLLAVLVLGYVFFFRSQTPRSDLPPDASPTAPTAQTGAPQGTPRTQYKREMDKAHAAAKAMQDERKEADSF